ncbi:uncharacterized protein ALTATR162_LOCUS11183 [Alternaria atra]|uniref:BTB domain-containing protein n=1 Tax=Alternaria atra TaxID=119953 RepID=A0A8J2N5D1_9PLEO|nr:uncharacterized protein ALTATR162_LOCUS11183 [Alternaria atra]CAG5184991.1 unnamed protein product [Alternaria atra]
MFATPVFVNSNILDPSIYGSKRDSIARTELSSRLSTTSSDASFGCLHRTASTSSNASKSSKGIIDLSADDPSAVAAMMQYCYQLDYTDQLAGWGLEVPEDVTLRSHVDVYMLAERYGVAGLKALALKKFEDFAAMVLVADGEEEQLLHAIRSIYAPERRANADDLKRVAIKLCANHVQAFIHGTGRTMALVYESMDELPDFRADLFEEMASRWR